MALTIAYWDIRGLAQAIRFQLEYSGIQYNDKRFQSGDAWFAEKANLGVDFPNLPYLIDGDVKLTQSKAISKYLARKDGKLVPTTDEEMRRVDVIEGEIIDLARDFGRLCYGDDFEKQKPDYVAKLPGRLEKYEKFLGDRSFTAGEKITWVDFWLYEYLVAHDALVEGILGKFPKLSAFRKRIEDIPQIAQYMKSDRFKARPFNNPGFAKWY
eukprot:TRINITY_DN541_c0_g1_i1.p1 TRINITY_DN541_c0_g1~~TRINITY_DN541_c0_g1_i1.p1  ORF type:complete len:212 (-),score=40.96 TRINITY_DN541_c0_g1_i1:56-691(-)